METHIVEDPQSHRPVADALRAALADPSKEVPDFISNLPADYVPTQRDVELARFLNRISSFFTSPNYRDPAQREAELRDCEQRKSELQADIDRAVGRRPEAQRRVAEAQAALKSAKRKLLEVDRAINRGKKARGDQDKHADRILELGEESTSQIGELPGFAGIAAAPAEESQTWRDTLQIILHQLNPCADGILQRDAEVREQQVCFSCQAIRETNDKCMVGPAVRP